MQPERWRQIEGLFHAALQVEPEQRATFLDNACLLDSDLKREVESLLSQGLSTSHGPLDRPAWENRADLRVDSITWRLPAGLQVGPYRIEAPLGAGGMGVVYKALDTKLNRPVAIKFVSDPVTNVTARHRFKLEAQMASSLNHPHIVTVHDAGDFAERQYLVTEFVDGVTLKEWARAETRNWQQIVELLTGVADGLATAHAAGILHRDVKPANILVAKNGYAKLADFGLAKFQDPTGEARTVEGLTRRGMILGTTDYMSPEQASGRPLDARSDIFSFGAVLYQMLAGKQPFRGETDLDVLEAIAHATPDPLGPTFHCRCGRSWKMLKGRRERYQSMLDVVQDLKRVPSQMSLPNASEQRTDRMSARRSHGWRVLVAGAVVLLVVASTILWQLRRADYFWQNPLAGARTERLTDFTGDEGDAAISPDGKFMVFLANRGGRFDVWLSQIGSSGFVNVTGGILPDVAPYPIRTVGFFGDGSQIWFSQGHGSGPYTLWTASMLGGEPHPFLAGVMEPVWSPDGSAMAYHTSDPGDPVFVADRGGRDPKRIFASEPGTHCHHLSWSPNGRFLYFVKGLPTTDETDIWRIPVLGSAPVTPERITTHNSSVAYLAWLDDRTLIYSATAENGSGQWLYALDVERRIPHRVSSGITEQYLSVTVSNSKPRRLIASVAMPVADLWTVPISDALGLKPTFARPVPNTRAVSPRVASDYLLYLSSKGDADSVWKLKDGAATELWKGREGGAVVAPAASRDGSRICFSAREQGRSHLYLMNSDGTSVRLLTDAFDVRSVASWSPDGKWVVVAGNDGKGTFVFKVPVDGGSPVRLTGTASYNPIWSPDGRFIVYSGPLQGATFLTKAVTPDNVPLSIPDIRVFYAMSTPSIHT